MTWPYLRSPGMLAGLFVGRPARRGRAVMPGSEDAGQSLNRQRCRDGSRSWSQAFRQPTPLQVSPPPMTRSSGSSNESYNWRCSTQRRSSTWSGTPALSCTTKAKAVGVSNLTITGWSVPRWCWWNGSTTCRSKHGWTRAGHSPPRCGRSASGDERRHRSANHGPSLRAASHANSGAVNIRLTDWEDHRSRPSWWTLCCKRSRHRIPDPSDGFLLSRHEMGGTASGSRRTPGADSRRITSSPRHGASHQRWDVGFRGKGRHAPINPEFALPQKRHCRLISHWWVEPLQ